MGHNPMITRLSCDCHVIIVVLNRWHVSERDDVGSITEEIQVCIIMCMS